VIKAVNRLEGTIYYQRSHVVEKYLDEFQILILEASYTDFCTIVVKFCHSLNDNNKSRREERSLKTKMVKRL